MEPEEEWEREGLLDPAWEKQQKKVIFFSVDLYANSILTFALPLDKLLITEIS